MQESLCNVMKLVCKVLFFICLTSDMDFSLRDCWISVLNVSVTSKPFLFLRFRHKNRVLFHVSEPFSDIKFHCSCTINILMQHHDIYIRPVIHRNRKIYDQTTNWTPKCNILKARGLVKHFALFCVSPIDAEIQTFQTLRLHRGQSNVGLHFWWIPQFWPRGSDFLSVLCEQAGWSSVWWSQRSNGNLDRWEESLTAKYQTPGMEWYVYHMIWCYTQYDSIHIFFKQWLWFAGG